MSASLFRALVFRIGLIILVFLSAVLQWRRAVDKPPESPLEDYCGVGVCDLQIPNRLLSVPDLPASFGPAVRELSSNPASPYRWADLAEVALRSGHQQAASYASERARLLGPKNRLIQHRAQSVAAELTAGR